MLSGVLKSKKAINVNIQIMRTFMKIRELLATNELLQRKIIQMENKYDSKIREIFSILSSLEDKKTKRKTIGFTK
jgi:hypothetical protein